MNISQNFDAGNIEVVNCEDAGNIQLKIRADKHRIFTSGSIFVLAEQKIRPARCVFSMPAVPPIRPDFRTIASVIPMIVRPG